MVISKVCSVVEIQLLRNPNLFELRLSMRVLIFDRLILSHLRYGHLAHLSPRHFSSLTIHPRHQVFLLVFTLSVLLLDH